MLSRVPLCAGWQLDVCIHAGAVLEVWRGTLADGTAAVFKRPREPWRRHPGAAVLLRREHDILAAQHHASIVRVLGFVEEPFPALALEYLPNGDLVPVVGAAPRHWVGAALDATHALIELHARGYVHGDVNARNVLLDAGGRAKLIDFGSAWPIGRPRPAWGRTRADEPLRFVLRCADTAGDVYALAVLLYQLWSGRLPFGPEPDSAVHSAGMSQPQPHQPPRSQPLPPRSQPLPPRSQPLPPLSQPLPPLSQPLPSLPSLPPLPPEPLEPLAPREPLAVLAERIRRTLVAEEASQVGTLMQFADVLESVHRGAA